MLTVCAVEVGHALPGKLKVLTLVFSDRNMRCSLRRLELESVDVEAARGLSYLYTKISAACKTG